MIVATDIATPAASRVYDTSRILEEILGHVDQKTRVRTCTLSKAHLPRSLPFIWDTAPLDVLEQLDAEGVSHRLSSLMLGTHYPL
jgi:hypothetical protein